VSDVKRRWGKYDGIDPGIVQIVRILAENGVETCQSCAASGPFGKGSGKRNGDPHSYLEPTVEFYGAPAAGPAALAVAMAHGLPVRELRRVWNVNGGEPTGPVWAMTFDLSPGKLVGWLEPGYKPYRKAHTICWCGAAA